MNPQSDGDETAFLRRQDRLALVDALQSLEVHDHLALIADAARKPTRSRLSLTHKSQEFSSYPSAQV
ncbi:MAG: hypothetical protein ABEK02_02570 [Haloquadratum sp.]